MKKTNIAELLKDCPKGMELDCAMCDNVTFVCILDGNRFPIHIQTPEGNMWLSKYGCMSLSTHAKCVIFPKGKTTWEGFVPPRKFKDGDILATEHGIFIGIVKVKNNMQVNAYCSINSSGCFEINSTYVFERLATEEEKEKLFNIIKANGYKWNAETKTLEKLIEPKFHEGQLITDGYVGGQITSIEDNYSCYKISDFMGGVSTSIPFALQDNYHLWTIQDAKDGDVLAQNWHAGDDYMENIIIFKKYHNNGVEGVVNKPCVEGYGNTFRNGKSISRKKAPHYSKTWTANFHPATKEEKQQLFDAIKEHGYILNSETKTLDKLTIPKFKVGDTIKDKNSIVWFVVQVSERHFDISRVPNAEGYFVSIEDQDDYELVPNKFDITTLVPFESKVLVRDDNKQKWEANFWGFYNNSLPMNFPFSCCGTAYAQCIPYEGNEHLLGKTDDCDEYYKTWE